MTRIFRWQMFTLYLRQLMCCTQAQLDEIAAQNDFHPIEAEARNKLLRDENGGDSDLVPSREIKIGKNCFIGCNSIILKGTVLGDGCVVGAGAVVAGKFEDNCVIAGNPARVIKRIDRQ